MFYSDIFTLTMWGNQTTNTNNQYNNVPIRLWKRNCDSYSDFSLDVVFKYHCVIRISSYLVALSFNCWPDSGLQKQSFTVYSTVPMTMYNWINSNRVSLCDAFLNVVLYQLISLQFKIVQVSHSLSEECSSLWPNNLLGKSMPCTDCFMMCQHRFTSSNSLRIPLNLFTVAGTCMCCFLTYTRGQCGSV